MTIIEQQINLKLESGIFTDSEREYIESLMTYKMEVNEEETYNILQIIRSLDSSSTQITKNYFINMLEDLYLLPKNPEIILAHRGENIRLTLSVPSDEDYTNSFLVIRTADTKTLLSNDNTAGSSAAIQFVTMEDISLTVGTFIKLMILTEGDTAGAANGDVEAVLAKPYLYVIEDSEAV